MAEHRTKALHDFQAHLKPRKHSDLDRLSKSNLHQIFILALAQMCLSRISTSASSVLKCSPRNNQGLDAEDGNIVAAKMEMSRTHLVRWCVYILIAPSLCSHYSTSADIAATQESSFFGTANPESILPPSWTEGKSVQCLRQRQQILFKAYLLRPLQLHKV